MLKLRKIIMIQVHGGDDISTDYTLEQYESTAEAIAGLGDYRVLEIINRYRAEQERADARSLLVNSLRKR